MEEESLRRLLEQVSAGEVAPEEAATQLRRLPFADLGFARIDHHRSLRQGQPEAVYGPGKTPDQVATIVSELSSMPGPVVLTRADHRQVRAALTAVADGAVYPPEAESCTVVWRPAPRRSERVLVLTAGTSDLPVAEECRATLIAHGFDPTVLADCGVAGIHRLFASADEVAAADAVVVVAGMEGALASIVGGLTGSPVVAVPTSTGYGAALEGVTALLAMLSSCAAGITVVGIDNGFGAASAVARILGRPR